MSGGLDADAGPLEQASAEVGDERFDEVVEVGDFVVEVEDPPGEGAHGDAGRGGGVVEVVVVGAPRGDGAHQLHPCQGPDHVADLVGRGDGVVAQQLQGLGSAAHSSGPGEAQDPQCFDTAALVLRRRQAPTGDHRAGGHLGVDGVGLAALTAITEIPQF